MLIFLFTTVQERDKFAFLYERYKNLLLYKAYGILHDYNLAEDAVSEAYIRVYKNLHKIDDPEDNRAAAFLVTILKNIALTMLESNKKQATEEFDENMRAPDDVEAQAIEAISTGRVFEIINKMEESYKSVLVLKHAYDYSHKQIADLLGISENNVTVRLHRAKKILAELLKAEHYE